MKNSKEFEVNMQKGFKFVPKEYHADATFYPHGCFGYCYRGNIYNDSGLLIGDYGTNDSVWIENNFQIEWR